MNGILLLLGTNLGDRKSNLEQAMGLLESKGVLPRTYSSIYESEPWGMPDQPWFLNQVIEIKTKLDPAQLLATCLETEIEMGRVRKQRWGERLIDIDILYYNDDIRNQPKLKLPHPAIASRRFTLVPLAEKWANETHPDLGLNQLELLDECTDKLNVRLFDDLSGH